MSGTLRQRVDVLEAIQRVQAGNADSAHDDLGSLGKRVEGLEREVLHLGSAQVVAAKARQSREFDQQTFARRVEDIGGRLSLSINRAALLEKRQDEFASRLGKLEQQPANDAAVDGFANALADIEAELAALREWAEAAAKAANVNVDIDNQNADAFNKLAGQLADLDRVVREQGVKLFIEGGERTNQWRMFREQKALIADLETLVKARSREFADKLETQRANVEALRVWMLAQDERLHDFENYNFRRGLTFSRFGARLRWLFLGH